MVNADAAVRDASGRILLKASARTVLGAGSLTSAANDHGRGGTLQVLGETVDVSGKIDASGSNGGGEVLVGGDAHGANSAVRNATTTTVTASANIAADAQETGNGGKVVVWADDTTRFAGRISARGGAETGDGGFVETSGKRRLAFSGQVDTSAPNGNTGNLLLDPNDFHLKDSGGDMTGASLSAALATSNVTIMSASGATAGNGDIFVDDVVGWSSNLLTLNAGRNIDINAVMTASGSSKLDLITGSGMVRTGFAAGGGFRGRVDFPGRSGAGILDINGDGYFVLNALGSPGSTTGTDLQGIEGDLNGFFALGTDIDAGATSGWNTGGGFASIGTFRGEFDGLGHTIDGLFVNSGSGGLFGFVDGDAALRNFGVTGATVNGGGRTGGVAGELSDGGGGIMSRVFFSGSVTGGDRVGGLVGRNRDDGRIVESWSAGTVNGSKRTGGLVGYNTGSISRSFSTATVTNTGDRTGGLAGYNTGDISDAYATGTVTGTSRVGGLIGRNNDDGFSNTVERTFASGKVTGSSDVGGLIGDDTGDVVSSSYWNIDSTGQATSAAGIGLSAAAALEQASYAGFDFGTTWWFSPGSMPQLRIIPTSVTTAAAPELTDQVREAINFGVGELNGAVDFAFIPGISDSNDSEGEISECR